MEHDQRLHSAAERHSLVSMVGLHELEEVQETAAVIWYMLSTPVGYLPCNIWM